MSEFKPELPRLRRVLPLALMALSLAISSDAAAATPAAAAAHSAAAARASCANAEVSPIDDPQLATEAILCLLNQERAKRDLPRLRSSTPLARAALGHSKEMVRKRYFAHTTPADVTFSSRIRRARYAREAKLGENLAWGTGEPALPREVVRNWMLSREHRGNILDRDFRAIGIGIARGVPVDATASAASAGATYTTDFGSR